MTQKQGIELEVIPNSKKFQIMGKNPWTKKIRIKLKSKAIDGKANKELITELKKILKTEVMIIQGQKSNKKTIIVNMDTNKAKEIIESKT
ncbi:MAG: DUF167 domain-containing protein [Candidatus Diapherotrites archaeon]